MAIGTIIVLIFIGAVFYHNNEQLNWLDSFYLTIMNTLTVGVNDFAPSNDYSKLFTMIYMIISVPTLLYCLGLIVEDGFEARVERIEERRKQDNK